MELILECHLHYDYYEDYFLRGTRALFLWGVEVLVQFMDLERKKCLC